jgi:sodium/potassium-transporting ATPase subunit alpha
MPDAKGNPTDAALLNFTQAIASTMGEDAEELEATHEKLFEIPFNSANKWMLTLVRKKKTPELEQGEPLMLVKGGPDVLFPYCTEAMDNDGKRKPLNNAALRHFHEIQAAWSAMGQRVLALCMRELEGFKLLESANEMEETMLSEMHGLTLIGLVAIQDPPRADVPGAVDVIRRAGVRIFMITGDFRLTAIAIAKQVFILFSKTIFPTAP